MQGRGKITSHGSGYLVTHRPMLRNVAPDPCFTVCRTPISVMTGQAFHFAQELMAHR